MNLIKRKTLLMGLFRCTHKYGSDEGAFLMLKQSVQAAGFYFLEPQPQTPSPEISWEAEVLEFASSLQPTFRVFSFLGGVLEFASSLQPTFR
ncbi:MAG: hypothetical protein DRQ99_06355 [Candidatus Parabeggiatoa sp. nov. 3]|nr:MAG: hypothetical protein DRQ99_06355 [Gammaproteobacteria bacterium]